MIGHDLKLLRIEAGLTQVNLSEKLQLGQGTISRIEKGIPTTTDVVERWVVACNGTLKVEGRDGLPQNIQKLLEISKTLDADDVDRLIKIARGLPAANPTFKDGVATAFAGMSPPENRESSQSQRSAQ